MEYTPMGIRLEAKIKKQISLIKRAIKGYFYFFQSIILEYRQNIILGGALIESGEESHLGCFGFRNCSSCYGRLAAERQVKARWGKFWFDPHYTGNP